MDRDEPRVIDAKFRVVQQPRRRWVISFDPNVVFVCAIGSAMAALRFLLAALQAHQR
jgi:hypothetical protein